MAPLSNHLSPGEGAALSVVAGPAVGARRVCRQAGRERCWRLGLHLLMRPSPPVPPLDTPPASGGAALAPSTSFSAASNLGGSHALDCGAKGFNVFRYSTDP